MRTCDESGRPGAKLMAEFEFRGRLSGRREAGPVKTAELCADVSAISLYKHYGRCPQKIPYCFSEKFTDKTLSRAAAAGELIEYKDNVYVACKNARVQHHTTAGWRVSVMPVMENLQ